MAGIAKHFAILALRHLLIYHDYLSIVGLSIDSLSHIPMYIASKLSWHVASFLEFPLASEREFSANVHITYTPTLRELFTLLCIII